METDYVIMPQCAMEPLKYNFQLRLVAKHYFHCLINIALYHSIVYCIITCRQINISKFI